MNISSESASGWKEVLTSIKQRSLQKIELDTIIPLVFKNTAHQKCVVHLKRNILNRVASKHKEQVVENLKGAFNLGLSKNNIKTAFKSLKLFLINGQGTTNIWKK
ncbi:transposase [Tenacibaculum maritimum]|uniref:transposase n=1 Tax=Tenacibaculum maritimum TaxID=107401 RepID=UPI001E5EBE21|nr:transposase [Tenacibaculum maritimum]MCD9585990.1 transposase [Tenacibaculum maritimum]